MLRERGIATFVSHSSLGAEERRLAEQAFAQRQNCVIVATSSLELGLDVGDLDRVIQIDAPGTVSSFLQRMGRTGRRADTTRNCLFLATNDEGLLRGAALIDLWERRYVEPVKAPPQPYHILAQQLMALILQERGIGRSEWRKWVEMVPAFSEMSVENVSSLIDFMVSKRILWSDNGILAFAPEGESLFGRRNFMELLSVFTSPPLFRVVFGQKELGFVHESTFYRREAGPTVLVLAGRSWKTVHLDWKRRMAHVESSDEKGRSRWFGEGQMLSHKVCQSIRRILASDDAQPCWSQRASQQLGELRQEFPWLSSDATVVLRKANGSIQWWTFAGGVANTILADALKSTCDVKGDNFCLRFSAPFSVDVISEMLDRLSPTMVAPMPSSEAMENLKFSGCLSPELAVEVFSARFSDRPAIQQSLAEPRRTVVEGDSRLPPTTSSRHDNDVIPNNWEG